MATSRALPTPSSTRSPAGSDAEPGVGVPPAALEIDPAVIGEAVFDAVKNKKFYILTHPEFEDAIKTRMEDILEKRDPTPAAAELTNAAVESAMK